MHSASPGNGPACTATADAQAYLPELLLLVYLYFLSG